MALQGASEHGRVNGPKSLPHAGSGKTYQYRGQLSVEGMAPYPSSLLDGKEESVIRIIGALVDGNEVETARKWGDEPPAKVPRKHP